MVEVIAALGAVVAAFIGGMLFGIKVEESWHEDQDQD